MSLYGHAVPVVDIRGMSPAEFGKARLGGIGASDAGALLGLSHYATNLDVWRSLTGRAAPWDGNEFTKWGHRLEGPIADGWAEDCPDVESIEDCHHILAHPDRDFVRATPDRVTVVAGVVGGAEIKNAGLRQVDSWDGDVDDGDFPDVYHAQVQHQLLVTGWPYVYLVALIDGNDLRWRRIEPNPTVHAAMLDLYDEFWAHVQADRPPRVTGPPSAAARSLAAVYDQPADTTVACDDLTGTFRALKDLRAARKQIDDDIETLSNDVKERLGNATRATVAGDVWATWSPQTRRTVSKTKVADLLGVTPSEVLDVAGEESTTRTFLIKDTRIQ